MIPVASMTEREIVIQHLKKTERLLIQKKLRLQEKRERLQNERREVLQKLKWASAASQEKEGKS